MATEPPLMHDTMNNEISINGDSGMDSNTMSATANVPFTSNSNVSPTSTDFSAPIPAASLPTSSVSSRTTDTLTIAGIADTSLNPNQPTRTGGPSIGDILSADVQKLVQKRSDCHDVCRNSILQDDIVQRIIDAYIGKAQGIANNIRADGRISDQLKNAWVAQLNTVAVNFKSQIIDGQIKLKKSPYGKSLDSSITAVYNNEFEKTIKNYIYSIIAKLNEQESRCNSLNANYFANEINAFNKNVGVINDQFIRSSPTGGATSTSGFVRQQNILY